MPKKRLAIVTTHPIQYNAPFFAWLQERQNIVVKVFYTWGKKVLEEKYDPGFAKSIQWDIPLLDGYEYEFVENVAKDPGSHHFKGIDNPGLVASIKSWDADAVLVYGWSFKSHLETLRYFHGKKTVLFRGDSISIGLTTAMSFVRNIFLTWIYRHIDFAFYVGTQNKKYYKQAGVKESKLIFAGHAIDNTRFKEQKKNSQEQVTEWKNLLGIQSDEIVMLYAGKLDANKNVELAAEAFVNTADKHFHFIIAGNGSTEALLKKSYSNQTNIHFLPFQNQSVMPGLYALADVFILSSLSETWGLSVNEAMACGKAILASDGCGCAADLVKGGINGYIFKSNDVDDLTAKMKMIDNKSTTETMGKNSEEMIEQWNFENICIAIEKIVGN